MKKTFWGLDESIKLSFKWWIREFIIAGVVLAIIYLATNAFGKESKPQIRTGFYNNEQVIELLAPDNDWGFLFLDNLEKLAQENGYKLFESPEALNRKKDEYWQEYKLVLWTEIKEHKSRPDFFKCDIRIALYYPSLGKWGPGGPWGFALIEKSKINDERELKRVFKIIIKGNYHQR